MKIKPFETMPRWVRLWTSGDRARYRPFGVLDFVMAIGVPSIYLGAIVGILWILRIPFPYFTETLAALVPAYLVIRFRADAWLRREWYTLTGLHAFPRNGKDVRRALSALYAAGSLRTSTRHCRVVQPM